MSDEIYEKFCYDGPCPSIASFYDRTLLLRGFSKSYGMPGWRLAYAAARPALKGLIEQMTTASAIYLCLCADAVPEGDHHGNGLRCKPPCGRLSEKNAI